VSSCNSDRFPVKLRREQRRDEVLAGAARADDELRDGRSRPSRRNWRKDRPDVVRQWISSATRGVAQPPGCRRRGLRQADERYRHPEIGSTRRTLRRSRDLARLDLADEAATVRSLLASRSRGPGGRRCGRDAAQLAVTGGSAKAHAPARAVRAIGYTSVSSRGEAQAGGSAAARGQKDLRPARRLA